MAPCAGEPCGEAHANSIECQMQKRRLSGRVPSHRDPEPVEAPGDFDCRVRMTLGGWVAGQFRCRGGHGLAPMHTSRYLPGTPVDSEARSDCFWRWNMQSRTVRPYSEDAN